jgi:hypothetical protein
MNILSRSGNNAPVLQKPGRRDLSWATTESDAMIRPRWRRMNSCIDAHILAWFSKFVNHSGEGYFGKRVRAVIIGTGGGKRRASFAGIFTSLPRS